MIPQILAAASCKNEPLVKFQEILAKRKVFNNCHVLFTLHYSSKNEITFLEILDMSTVPGYSGIISNFWIPAHVQEIP